MKGCRQAAASSVWNGPRQIFLSRTLHSPLPGAASPIGDGVYVPRVFSRTTRDDYTHPLLRCVSRRPISSTVDDYVRISPVIRTGLLSLSILLGACASNDLLIERELAAVETRLAAIDVRLADIEHRQREGHEALTQQQRSGFAALMETTVAEVDRLVHQRPPVPILIRTTLADDAQPEQRPSTTSRPVQRPAVISDKQLVGSIERVHLSPPGITLQARIDTGAESSSLDARDITEFKRDGNTWVRFRIMDGNNEESVEIERRVVRHVRILQSSATEADRRPVVRLRVAIGSHAQIAEFTLSDREHLSYQVLIGRNVLTDVMVVDVSRTHIAPLAETQTGNDPAAAR